jgi:ribosome-associated protein
MKDPDPQQAPQPPSKSRRKRDALALQALGEALLEVPESQWSTLGLPDELSAALREVGKLHGHGARKRHLQYIGKLMRSVDVGPIREHLQQRGLRNREQASRQRQLEDWRERLIAGGDTAIQAFLQEHTQADRQRLRTLVRQARKQRDHDQPPAASRALLRYLREV